MENNDTQPKQSAVDNKSAYAGNAPLDTYKGVDQLGTDAGLDMAPEEPLAIADKLAQRDQQRPEINAPESQP